MRAIAGLGAAALAATVAGCSSPGRARSSGGRGAEGDLPATGTGTGATAASTAFRSRPDLRPPPIVVDAQRAGGAPGVVLTDCHAGTGQQGPMIIGGDGDLIWFVALSDHGTPDLRAFNLRVETYRGRPVLCWFEGAVVDGHGEGTYRIVDEAYREVATVKAANGLNGDLHDFSLTDRGTALFTTYGTATGDLSGAGGSSSGSYFYGEVQEVDVATGRLVFSWRCDDHVDFVESYVTPPSDPTRPWDYFHLNSVAVDPSDGNIVVSSRNCWGIYKVDRSTGALLWRLGGKRSDFSMGAGTRFAYQHDVTPQPDGTYTIFDNEGSPWVRPPSRGLAIAVDESRRTATLVRQRVHSPPVRSGSLGSVQELAGGHTFIGWGTSTYFTEYDPSGRVVTDAHLAGDGILSYRAFKQPWSAQPTERPAVAVERLGAGTVVHVSWNGATAVTTWRVLGGPSPDALSSLGAARRHGFETRISLSTTPRHVAVEAMDASGHPLGRSATREV